MSEWRERSGAREDGREGGKNGGEVEGRQGTVEAKRWRGSPSTRPSPVGRPVGVGLRWESAMLRSGQDHTALLPKQKQQNQGRAAGGQVTMSITFYLTLPSYIS